MARRAQRAAGPAALDVRGLHVYYGRSHALQGVSMTLQSGVLSVVGRNGMGKTTLCQSIIGLVKPFSGSIRVQGQDLIGLTPTQIARLGVGYVPQGRRLWPSLTVDEHLQLVARGGAWTVERIYSQFPRLAARKRNGGGQLSGGEQQMLAIARALLLNPKLLVMDEPTEGLAPVIVAQVEEMLLTLAAEGEMSILVIEQNIGVATEIAEEVAIMVNGQVNRTLPAARIAADRGLQQRLLGVGRHGHDDADGVPDSAGDPAAADDAPAASKGPTKIWVSNPQIPTRWSRPVPVVQIEAAARTVSSAPALGGGRDVSHVELRPLSASGEPVALVCGTLDTKGEELRFLRDILKAEGLQARLVDLSTSNRPSSADVPPSQVALHHPRGLAGVMTDDRGTSVAAMTLAFERWMARQTQVAGVIAAGGSGGTALVAPAFRTLPIGIPKVIVSTVASGDVSAYVGPADIMMMYSVTDVQGLNAISRDVLANGAHALAGAAKARIANADSRAAAKAADKPALGLTMFGVTTPCVRQIVNMMEAEYDCLVFHATGVGGRSMEKLIDSRLMGAVIDATTTEVCDLFMGGVFAATEDRFGAMIRAKTPYVGACGALDMVNFGAPDTTPERYAGRLFYEHNPQITLMRTTPDENQRVGAWIGERLNQMDAPARFFLPEGGVSMLDAPGQPFHDPDADAALFDALEGTVRQTAERRLIRRPENINDPAFSAALVDAFREVHGVRDGRARTSRRKAR